MSQVHRSADTKGTIAAAYPIVRDTSHEGFLSCISNTVPSSYCALVTKFTCT